MDDGYVIEEGKGRGIASREESEKEERRATWLRTSIVAIIKRQTNLGVSEGPP